LAAGLAAFVTGVSPVLLFVAIAVSLG